MTKIYNNVYKGKNTILEEVEMELSKNTKIKTLLVIILVSFAMIFMLCFNTLALNTSYNRPWNTPTKSIEGGAVFKSEGYIKEGQYNSYLVRFNVEPI